MSEYYKFFQNKKCEYFPCHKGIPEEDFNCLFYYCPLYPLGKSCGGILHLDTGTHANLKQLCNTCAACKNLSCPSRKSPLQELPHTYDAMQIFHIK